jgi:hypothetical protein
MARGNEIIVSSEPQGKFKEGYIKADQTVLVPGTVWQIDATVALRGGRHTYKVYQPGADGENPLGDYWVLLPDHLQGKTATDAYTAGERAFFYSPCSGEELNLIVANIAGTADDHSAGEKMMLDTGTGKLIATTGSPENEVAVLKEDITDPTADTLAWVEWVRA